MPIQWAGGTSHSHWLETFDILDSLAKATEAATWVLLISYYMYRKPAVLYQRVPSDATGHRFALPAACRLFAPSENNKEKDLQTCFLAPFALQIQRCERVVSLLAPRVA